MQGDIAFQGLEHLLGRRPAMKDLQRQTPPQRVLHCIDAPIGARAAKPCHATAREMVADLQHPASLRSDARISWRRAVLRDFAR